MKLAWATPLNIHSAIGRAGVETAEALAARGHEVEVWACEHESLRDTPRHPTRLPVRHVSQVHLKSGGVDLAIVNFGDNFLFHAGALEVIDEIPSVGVFHDHFIHNLFAGWLAAGGVSPPEHRRIVEEIYGPDVWPLAQAAVRRELPLEEIAARLPMTEWVARRCKAALSHADFYRARLEAACPGPVDMARLPWKGRAVGSLPKRRQQPPIRALTVGVMNPNKCCEAVIRAIGGSDRLKAELTYVMAGPIDDDERTRLGELAQALGVRVEMLGSVTDAQLEAELDAARILVCLRRPVLEGASASAIEAMLAGRPTIVADVGFYAELPDALVVKVDPAVEPPAVAAALEGLLDQPHGRRIGEAASAWAAETFTIDRYLDVLEPLMEATVAILPSLRTAAQFGQVFGRMGLPANDPAAARALAMIENFSAPANTTGNL